MTDLFDGSTYEPEHDEKRLSRQLERVRDLMLDGRWRTLVEIEVRTGDGIASISARLRDLRKHKFGGFTVQRRRRGLASKGLHEYRVLPAQPGPQEERP